MRIASLLPSATEIVCSIGLKDSLVAVSHECDYPLGVRNVERVTRNTLEDIGNNSAEIDHHIRTAIHQGSSLFTLDHEALERLRPELILTQELCKVCAISYEEVSETVTLIDADTKIVSIEPKNLLQICDSIVEIGRLTEREKMAVSVADELKQRLSDLQQNTGGIPKRPRVLCLEWLDPLMVAGHWVPDMVRIAGGEDVLGTNSGPSYRISWDAIIESRPDFIIAMPCGFDLEETVNEFRTLNWPPEWTSLAAVKNRNVFAVDGSSYFNRPGPRVVDGIEVLLSILNRPKSTAEPNRSLYTRLY